MFFRIRVSCYEGSYGVINIKDQELAECLYKAIRLSENGIEAKMFLQCSDDEKSIAGGAILDYRATNDFINRYEKYSY